MKILNTEKEDYHVHSINFSDGWNTIDEIVKFAGELGMSKIAICDHSQEALNAEGLSKKTFRLITKRWKNVHNDVEVIFGVEADLLNEEGDICSEIDGVEGDFILLSYHENVYSGDKTKVAEGFIKAIQRFHSKINFIGHVCLYIETSDVKKIILEANRFNIPLEINAKYYLRCPENWDVVIENADRVYVNSDAHILSDLKNLRKEAFELLEKRAKK